MSKVCPRPQWQQDCSAKGIELEASNSKVYAAIPKDVPRKSSNWLNAVRSIENCVLCGAHGTQAAHRNEGKAKGRKVDDALTAALCLSCHHELDNGKNLTQDQRRAMMDRAIVLTVKQLYREGKIVCVL